MTIRSTFEDPFPEIRYPDGNRNEGAQNPPAIQASYHTYSYNYNNNSSGNNINNNNDSNNQNQDELDDNHQQSLQNDINHLNISNSDIQRNISETAGVSPQSSNRIAENQSVVIEIGSHARKQQTGCDGISLRNRVISKELVDQYERKSENNSLRCEQNKENVTSNDKINSQESENQSHQLKLNESATNKQQISPGIITPIYKQTGYIGDKLFNGSSFIGSQNSKKDKYNVKVDILDVKLEDSYLCGYLCINHLTKNHPSLTTFFEGEIISRRYPFLTRKWQATERNDQDHWCKFEHFNENYQFNFNSDDFDYGTLRSSDFVYMRWKERFLVPDHTIKNVEGASYEGFYYICYSKKTKFISGYYFHQNENQFESYQKLSLQLDEVNTSGVFQFR